MAVCPAPLANKINQMPVNDKMLFFLHARITAWANAVNETMPHAGAKYVPPVAKRGTSIDPITGLLYNDRARAKKNRFQIPGQHIRHALLIKDNVRLVSVMYSTIASTGQPVDFNAAVDKFCPFSLISA